VRDLILFAEHRPPRRARCQVTEQIREVVAFEEGRLESEGVSVRTNLEPVPDIWADHNHLQEVLLHVIQNAQHAMVEAHGGGMLTIKTTMVESGVRIEVADDGPGIPPEHLPRIFNPFFTTKHRGTAAGSASPSPTASSRSTAAACGRRIARTAGRSSPSISPSASRNRPGKCCAANPAACSGRLKRAHLLRWRPRP
jgi:hypothetical protein